MAYSVAYQHTDGYRNHDGSYKLHGVKKVGTDRKSVGPLLYLCNTVPDPCDLLRATALQFSRRKQVPVPNVPVPDS